MKSKMGAADDCSDSADLDAATPACQRGAVQTRIGVWGRKGTGKRKKGERARRRESGREESVLAREKGRERVHLIAHMCVHAPVCATAMMKGMIHIRRCVWCGVCARV